MELIVSKLSLVLSSGHALGAAMTAIFEKENLQEFT
jgi:hypothetical protein